MDRQAKETRLFELLYVEATGQYGAAGSFELEEHMSTVEEQIAVMSDAELDANLARRTRAS